MRVYNSSAEHLQQVSQLLRQGEVVAIPTETVYGLAADALNSEAVAKISEIKGRPAHNPLIIHVRSSQVAEQYVEVNTTARVLMDAFWPGSLSLVLPKKKCIPDIVSAGLPTVAIRCPRHPAMHAILEQINRPLAAPSANPSNYISPTRVEHVIEHLEGRLEYALDGGPCEAGMESTIIDMSEEASPKLLRPGPIALSEIERVIGKMIRVSHHSTSEKPISSPGQLPLHYSPNKELLLLKHDVDFEFVESQPSVAFIKFRSVPLGGTDLGNLFILSRSGSAKEAESHLYSLLQSLDQSDFNSIKIDPIPDGEEWMAIRDRLTRAANRKSPSSTNPSR